VSGGTSFSKGASDMKLFNPWDANAPQKGRPTKVKDPNRIEDKVYAASIYEGLRHNRGFSEFLENVDGSLSDALLIRNLIRGYMKTQGIGADSTWEDLPKKAQDQFVAFACRGVIQTEIDHSFYEVVEGQEQFVRYKAPIADVLLAMLEDGRIDNVKRFLAGKGNRLIELPDTIYQGGGDLQKLSNQVLKHITDHFDTHGNRKPFPSKEAWRVFLELKKLIMETDCLFRAYARLMAVEATKTKGAEVRWRKELVEAKILEDADSPIEGSWAIVPGCDEWKFLKNLVESKLNRMRDKVSRNIGAVAEFCQELLPTPNQKILDFLRPD